MYVLDTDHLSILEWTVSAAAQKLSARLNQEPTHEIATTIINYEEQTRGWLAYLAKHRDVKDQIEGYRRLNRQLDGFRELVVLDFDHMAADILEELRKARVRVGTSDLKIAAICLASNATLLSRNLADFRRVPKLLVEDWTK